MTADKKELGHAEQNAAAWLGTIKEQVACLQVDRERLAELREERGHHNANLKKWAKANPDDAAELTELEKAVTVEGEELDEESIRQRIQESPLSVQVRGGWHDPGSNEEGAAEYEILLSTGGPAPRIIGDLSEHCEPTSARLQHQDWGTPWTDWQLTSGDEETILAWAGCFYFGG